MRCGGKDWAAAADLAHFCGRAHLTEYIHGSCSAAECLSRTKQVKPPMPTPPVEQGQVNLLEHLLQLCLHHHDALPIAGLPDVCQIVDPLAPFVDQQWRWLAVCRLDPVGEEVALVSLKPAGEGSQGGSTPYGMAVVSTAQTGHSARLVQLATRTSQASAAMALRNSPVACQHSRRQTRQ